MTKSLLLGLIMTTSAWAAPCDEYLEEVRFADVIDHALNTVPGLPTPAWRGRYNGREVHSIVILVGPESARKTRLTQALRDAVVPARIFDIYTVAPGGFEADIREFYAFATFARQPPWFHVLDVTVTNAASVRWTNPWDTRYELEHLGFERSLIVRTLAVYYVAP